MHAPHARHAMPPTARHEAAPTATRPRKLARLAGGLLACAAGAAMAGAGSQAPSTPAATAMGGEAPPASRAGADWQLAGRLGQAQYVVVPQAKAKERAYYDALIAELCPSTATCWLRFFTNSTQAPVTMPLPDAITQEPTAMFQQSAKYGGRNMFQWSCRLAMSPAGECF